MMNMLTAIDKLENEGFVIVNVKCEDGTVIDIEMTEGNEQIVAAEVVTVEEYEANGYEVDGLEGKWVEVEQ